MYMKALYDDKAQMKVRHGRFSKPGKMVDFIVMKLKNLFLIYKVYLSAPLLTPFPFYLS